MAEIHCAWVNCSCVVPVRDQGLVPLWPTGKMSVSGHVCVTTARLSHHLYGVGVQLPRHLQAIKLLHFSESVFEVVQRAAPDAVGGADTHLGEIPRQIILDKERTGILI